MKHKHGIPHQETLTQLSQQFLNCMSRRDYRKALEIGQRALTLAPVHAGIVGDVALCHLRLGQYALARRLYERACALAPRNSNLYDGLTETCARLGLHEEMVRHGQKSLSLKHQETRNLQRYPIPQPLPGLSADRSRNIIAFSLFGDQPKYCETALLNVTAAQALMPQWTCRFYMDLSVPQAIRERLHSAGAQVVLVSEEDRRQLNPLMWRFLVADDPGVDRYVLRDADALVSTRDAAAVQAWLDSGRAFHIMRDYFTHTELIMAGMWGGCGGVLPPLRESMAAFSRQDPNHQERLADQHFLRHHVWPTVRQSVCAHDSVFGFLDAGPFPPHLSTGMGEDFHVGANISGTSIGGDNIGANVSHVLWSLHDEANQLVCAYTTPVTNNSWRTTLPLPYVNRIRAAQWRVQTQLQRAF